MTDILSSLLNIFETRYRDKWSYWALGLAGAENQSLLIAGGTTRTLDMLRLVHTYLDPSANTDMRIQNTQELSWFKTHIFICFGS